MHVFFIYSIYILLTTAELEFYIIHDPKTSFLGITEFVIERLYVLGGFFNTHFPSWFAWAKYLSFLYYPFAAIVTLLFGDIEPFRYTRYFVALI